MSTNPANQGFVEILGRRMAYNSSGKGQPILGAGTPSLSRSLPTSGAARSRH